MSSTDQFFQERKYLKASTDSTVEWYRNSFRAFEGALESTETVHGEGVP